MQIDFEMVFGCQFLFLCEIPDVSDSEEGTEVKWWWEFLIIICLLEDILFEWDIILNKTENCMLYWSKLLVSVFVVEHLLSKIIKSK